MDVKDGALVTLAALFWPGKLERLFWFPWWSRSTPLTPSTDPSGSLKAERKNSQIISPVPESFELWLTQPAVACTDLTSLKSVPIKAAWALADHQVGSVPNERQEFPPAN